MRYTANGKCVASFALAVNRQNKKDSEVDFIDIVAWEQLGEVCGNNLSKGRRVLVEGRLQIRSYEAQDGQKRRVAEVVAQNVEFLDSKKADGENSGSNPEQHQGFGFGPSLPGEDIPFAPFC